MQAAAIVRLTAACMSRALHHRDAAAAPAMEVVAVPDRHAPTKGEHGRRLVRQIRRHVAQIMGRTWQSVFRQVGDIHGKMRDIVDQAQQNHLVQIGQGARRHGRLVQRKFFVREQKTVAPDQKYFGRGV